MDQKEDSLTIQECAQERFCEELREVLLHLYDPMALGQSSLLRLFGVEERAHPSSALRNIITRSIAALKPEANIPLHSNAWRFYHLLTWRYVEQGSQREVAASLAISPRQLRRLEGGAIQLLADYLWHTYHLADSPSPLGETSPDDSLPASAVQHAPADQREQELAWMATSFPTRRVATGELLARVLATAAPLVEELDVQLVTPEVAELPPVAGQVVTLRQALLSLLTGALHAAPGGRVDVAVRVEAGEVLFALAVTTGDEGVPSGNYNVQDVVEHLDMARQFTQLFGGSLEVTPGQGYPLARAHLRFPTVAQRPLLAIDDNTDALQLLRRHLAGTRYLFYGTSDPEEALQMALELQPVAIVLDIMLPNIDGWELLGRLREHPALQQVPIIVCTILPQDRLALTLGASAFIRKPFTRETLLATLDSTMGGRQ